MQSSLERVAIFVQRLRVVFKISLSIPSFVPDVTRVTYFIGHRKKSMIQGCEAGERERARERRGRGRENVKASESVGSEIPGTLERSDPYSFHLPY